MPDKEKKEKSDFIISTDQSIEDTEEEVRLLIDKFKKIKSEAWESQYSNVISIENEQLFNNNNVRC